MPTDDDTSDDSDTQLEDRAARTEPSETEQVRKVIADTYTFVRSAEISRTILGFTLDHYIDEAKRKIKQDRVLRSASDPLKGVGTRPSQLDALEKLEEDFNKSFEAAKKMAVNANTSPEET